MGLGSANVLRSSTWRLWIAGLRFICVEAGDEVAEVVFCEVVVLFKYVVEEYVVAVVVESDDVHEEVVLENVGAFYSLAVGRGLGVAMGVSHCVRTIVGVSHCVWNNGVL